MLSSVAFVICYRVLLIEFFMMQIIRCDLVQHLQHILKCVRRQRESIIAEQTY
jgi:hypothetical protein